MCRGAVPKRPKTLKVPIDLLKKESGDKSRDSIRTLSFSESSTCSSSCCSFRDDEPKSCLKIKTQEESLKTNTNRFHLYPAERSVSFSTLEIRLYPLAIGDNPCVSSGPPMTMGWKHAATLHCKVDEFKQESCSREDLRIPSLVRQELLHDEGFARSEIRAATVQAMKIKEQRLASMKDSLPLIQAKELASRKLKKWILHTPSDKKLYQQWKEQQEAIHSNQLVAIACPL